MVAYGCLWLPMVAYGCLWLPMHRATIKKRLAEAPALAPAWRSCCGWGHLLLPAVSTGAVQQLGATGVTAPLTTPGFFKERDFPITDLLLLAVVWSLPPSCYQRSDATVIKQHLVSLREVRESIFCNVPLCLLWINEVGQRNIFNKHIFFLIRSGHVATSKTSSFAFCLLSSILILNTIFIMLVTKQTIDKWSNHDLFSCCSSIVWIHENIFLVWSANYTLFSVRAG